MELLLNLAWLLLAAFMLAAWFKPRRQEAACPHCARRFDKSTQFIALCVLLLILFPVISVSDDLLAAQYTTETDSSVRKHHVGCCSGHQHTSAAGVEAAAEITLPAVAPSKIAPSQANNDAPALNPAFYSIENRPPPSTV